MNRLTIQLEHDGLFLVDVGWKGSIQNNIFYALDEQIDVNGYYVGLLSPTDLQPLNSKKESFSVIFPSIPLSSMSITTIDPLFEMMLGATMAAPTGIFHLKEFPPVQTDKKSTVLKTANAKDESTW